MAYSDIDSGKVLNKEGLLVLSNEIKSYIDINSGSGESGLSLSIWGNPYTSTSPWATVNATSATDFISKIITGNPILSTTSDGFKIVNLKAELPSGISQILYWDDTSNGNKMLNITNQTWFYLTNYHSYQMFKYNDTSVVLYHTIWSGRDYYSHLTELLPVDNSTYGAYNLGTVLNNLNAKIPAVPSTDGNYKLTTSISSGTATTEWTEDSGSGGSSYTFANGLTENNGTVSLDLNDKFLKPYNNSVGIGSFITPNNQNNNTGWYNLVVGKSEGNYKTEPTFQCKGSNGSILFGKILAYNSNNRGAIISGGSNGGNIVGGSVNSYTTSSKIEADGASNIIIGYADGGSIIATGSCNIIVGDNTASNGYISGNMCAGDSAISANSCQAFGTSIQVYGDCQMGHGKNNVVDKNNIFAEIVGNGNNYNSRSNASALDWSGNQYLAGNLYVGCNDYSTTANGLTTANCGGNKVATESYVDTRIPAAPTTDGTYTLQCVVSSGTPTYSWVSV